MLRQTAQPEMGQANPTFILLSFLMPSAHALTRPFPGHPHFIQDIYPHPLRSLLISSFSPQGRICKIVVVVGAGDMWITDRHPPRLGEARRLRPIPAVVAPFFIPRRLGITCG
ncbi:hypothetical protein [Thermanaerothrix sp.]|uniref:hypothetical protein n=1 Tax=Thermanaerothrix sp. TaxID=2972675 RepID=UPI002ADE7589|nr:hypothetical protein [Thermanaerothrix sp.]